MSWSRRRPTGGYGQHLPYFGRRDFVDACTAAGRRVEFRRVRRGEWNEATEVLVDGATVDCVLRGERTDWRRLLADVEQPHGRP
jgi:hypothetical protein